MAVASGTYQMIDSFLPTDVNFTLTLSNSTGGTSGLETNLQGLAAKDVSYVTNAFLADVTQNPGNVFQVDSLPDNFSNVQLKARWKVFARTHIQRFEIELYQGKPFLATGGACSDGVAACIASFTPVGIISSLGYTLGVWNDLLIPIDESLITDRTDLWIWIAMDRHPNQGVANPNRAVEQLSWLVLRSDFPISSGGDSPTTPDTINGLSKVVVALSNLGDDGFFRYCYRVVPVGADGFGPSDEVSIENSPSALDSTDKICLSWPDVTGATSYKVYRTCSPSSASLGTGLIATVLPGQGTCGGGGGSGTGTTDDGTGCITDCDAQFPEALCQDPTTVTFPAKETPTTV